MAFLFNLQTIKAAEKVLPTLMGKPCFGKEGIDYGMQIGLQNDVERVEYWYHRVINSAPVRIGITNTNNFNRYIVRLSYEHQGTVPFGQEACTFIWDYE